MIFDDFYLKRCPTSAFWRILVLSILQPETPPTAYIPQNLVIRSLIFTIDIRACGRGWNVIGGMCMLWPQRLTTKRHYTLSPIFSLIGSKSPVKPDKVFTKSLPAYSDVTWPKMTGMFTILSNFTRTFLWVLSFSIFSIPSISEHLHHTL